MFYLHKTFRKGATHRGCAFLSSAYLGGEFGPECFKALPGSFKAP